MKPTLIKITTYNDLIQNPFSEGSTSHIAFEQVYHLAGAKKHPVDDLFYQFEKGEVLLLSIPAFQAWREQLAKMAGYPLLEKKPLQICGLQQIQKSYTVTCESGEEGYFSDLLCFGITTRVLGTSICKSLSNDRNR